MQIDWIQAEHKIRGRSLLKLNIDILKSEFGIMEYGTREEIEEAVNKLRQEGECEWPVATDATDFFVHPLDP